MCACVCAYPLTRLRARILRARFMTKNFMNEGYISSSQLGTRREFPATVGRARVRSSVSKKRADVTENELTSHKTKKKEAGMRRKIKKEDRKKEEKKKEKAASLLKKKEDKPRRANC